MVITVKWKCNGKCIMFVYCYIFWEPGLRWSFRECFQCITSHNENSLVNVIVVPYCDWYGEHDPVSTEPVGVLVVNTLGPRQNGRHFADDIFKCIFVNENVWIPIKISLKFVPKGSINNIPALVQIMAWRRPGDQPLSEPMTVNLPTHICVTRPQ